jgi:hypothetical protein
MKFRILISMLLVATLAATAFSQADLEPLTKDQVTDLVNAEMDAPALVKLIQDHGINFELTDDYLEALRKAGAKEPVIQALRNAGARKPDTQAPPAAKPTPLTKEMVMKLVAGGVPKVRTVAAIQQRGIDFVPDEDYLKTLRLAGASDEVIAALQEAVVSNLTVTTSPNAEIHLDNELRGHADSQGVFTAKLEPGNHALQVSLPGKQDFQRSIYLRPLETTNITASLLDVRPASAPPLIPTASDRQPAHLPSRTGSSTAGNAPLSCEAESTLRSPASSTPLSLRIVNTTNGIRKVYWIDFSGRRAPYATLKPGGSYMQSTYTTHIWLITNSSERCVAVFQPGLGDSTITIDR